MECAIYHAGLCGSLVPMDGFFCCLCDQKLTVLLHDFVCCMNSTLLRVTACTAAVFDACPEPGASMALTYIDSSLS